jgi:REP element-mobilizing transposase RayT
MPRLARLDAPGVLHHIMGRGIERNKIFTSDKDREDFIARLSAMVEEGAMDVYAWALLPNHFLCRAQHKACYVKLKIM